MKTLGWPPTYVARCPVTLFEAARGSSSWQTGGTVGELHMRPMGGTVLHFQLNDLLDGQVLFEHTMHKPNAFSMPADRFFVIRQENESFRGFGFRDRDAAWQMKERIEKVVKPFAIGSASSASTTTQNQEKATSGSAGHSQAAGSLHKKSEVFSSESIPKCSSVRSKSLQREKSSSQQPSVATSMFAVSSTKSHASTKWHRFTKGLRTLSCIFVSKGHEMEIGYPTDVKHIAHIGWDGPSINGPSGIAELRPGPDFSSGPLSDFGQPRDPSWIHDAVSAAKWTSQGLLGMLGLPPDPPHDFTNSPKVDSKAEKSKHLHLKSKSQSKGPFQQQNS